MNKVIEIDNKKEEIKIKNENNKIILINKKIEKQEKSNKKYQQKDKINSDKDSTDSDTDLHDREVFSIETIEKKDTFKEAILSLENKELSEIADSLLYFIPISNSFKKEFLTLCQKKPKKTLEFLNKLANHPVIEYGGISLIKMETFILLNTFGLLEYETITNKNQKTKEMTTFKSWSFKTNDIKYFQSYIHNQENNKNIKELLSLYKEKNISSAFITYYIQKQALDTLINAIHTDELPLLIKTFEEYTKNKKPTVF